MPLQLSLDRLCDFAEIAAMDIPNNETRTGSINLLDADQAGVSQRPINVLSEITEAVDDLGGRLL
jgi:hypothetical protein